MHPRHPIRLVALVALAAVLAAGAAQARTSGKAAGDLTFAYANVFDKSPLFKMVADDLQKLGPKVGVKVTRFDNKFDAQAALNNATLMVQQKPDMIIDWAGVDSVGPALGRLFQRAKIPCIAVNQKIPGCPWFNLVNRDLGVDGAKIAIAEAKKRGWTAKDMTLILVAAPGAGAEVNSNSRYFYSNFAKAFPEMKQLGPTDITDTTTKIGDMNAFVVDGKAQLEATFTSVKNTLQLIPTGRHLIVFTINDDSGLGGWRAITQAHREKDTLIIGQGANEAGLKQLRTNPAWIAEGSVFFEYWAPYLLAMGKAVLAGAKAPALTRAPQVVLSKENVDTYYKGSHAKKAPPLAPQNAYLLKTGVLQKLGIAKG